MKDKYTQNEKDRRRIRPNFERVRLRNTGNMKTSVGQASNSKRTKKESRHKKTKH